MATSRTAALPRTSCACTHQSHERFKASTKAWRAAVFVGYQTGHPSTDLYEIRLCPAPGCGSSMARAVVVVSLRYVRMPRRAVATVARGRFLDAQAKVLPKRSGVEGAAIKGARGSQGGSIQFRAQEAA